MEDDIKPADSHKREEDVLHDLMAFGAPKNRIKPGDAVDVMDKDPTIRHILIGLGWDMKKFDREPADLDASVFLLDKNERTRLNEDFVFYNNPQDLTGAVRHAGDSRTGAGDGDDEIIHIELTRLSFEIAKIVFVLSVYDEDLRGDDFTQVKNIYFRLTNAETGHELFRLEMDESTLGKTTGLIIGELERMGPKWTFRARGEPVSGGLQQIARNYAIIVAEDVQA